jgi:hypothetical protein
MCTSFKIRDLWLRSVGGGVGGELDLIWEKQVEVIFFRNIKEIQTGISIRGAESLALRVEALS